MAILWEHWHTTNLEEGECEGGGGQPSSDGAVELDGGALLLEYWHTTYLEEGMREGCSGQPGGGGALMLDLGVLAYNIPGGRHV